MANSDLFLPLEARQLETGSIRGTAYTGGLMTVANFGLVAISIDGIELPESGRVAVCEDHRTELANGVLGSARVIKANGQIKIEGKLADTRRAQEIRAMAADGLSFQLSVGMTPSQTKSIAAGDRVEVNGRVIEAKEPWTLVEAGRLFEVSLVLRGADQQTRAVIAQQPKGETMENEIQAAVSAERDRIAAIAELGKKYADLPGVDSVLRVAVDEGQSIEATRSDVLKLVDNMDSLEQIRASRRANHGPAIHVSGDRPQPSVDLIAAALLQSAGHSRDLVARQFGEKVANESQQFSGLGILDAAKLALEASGQSPRGLSKAEVLKASGTTTFSLPSVFENALHKSTAQYFSEAPSVWREIASVRSVSDFRSHSAVALHANESFQQVADDGELKHGGLLDSKLSFSVDTFGQIFGLTRKDLINDDLSLLSSIPEKLGQAAMRTINDAFAEHLLSNADSHWSAGNNNYMTGGASALSASTFEEAFTKMVSQVDSAGNVLDISPRILLVPPELRGMAVSILESESLAYLLEPDPAASATTVTSYPNANPWRRTVSLLVEPRLSASRYSGASETLWFLLASPANVPFIVAFLNGRATPTIETEQADFHKLGVQMRAYLDFGIARGNSESSVRADGA